MAMLNNQWVWYQHLETMSTLNLWLHQFSSSNIYMKATISELKIFEIWIVLKDRSLSCSRSCCIILSFLFLSSHLLFFCIPCCFYELFSLQGFCSSLTCHVRLRLSSWWASRQSGDRLSWPCVILTKKMSLPTISWLNKVSGATVEAG